MKLSALTATLLFLFAATPLLAAEEEGFTSIWDGKSFTNWKASENTDSWQIEDGKLVCKGPRSHLFYTGEMAPFKNFHFKVDVMTTKGSNSGIYFHTKYQETGWPSAGYEAQVNNTHRDPKRTASLYAVENVMKAPAKDGEWFTEEIIVKGRNIKILVDGKVLVDFTEEEDRKPGKQFARKLDSGTFAFQAHDPQSVVYFKNVRVKKLDD